MSLECSKMCIHQILYEKCFLQMNKRRLWGMYCWNILVAYSAWNFIVNIEKVKAPMKAFSTKEWRCTFVRGSVFTTNPHLSWTTLYLHYIGSLQELAAEINHAITWRFWLVIKRMTADRVFIARFFMTFLFTLSISWPNLFAEWKSRDYVLDSL